MPSQGYWIPRARTLSQGEIKYDLEIRQNPEKGKPNQNASVTGVEFGLWDEGRFSVEAGGDWVEPTTDDLAYGLTGNLKVSYQSVVKDGWAASLGAKDFAARTGQHDDDIFYATVEAAVGPEWVVSLGGYAGQESRIKTPSGVFAGAWKKIQSGAGDVGVEWMSGDGKWGYLVPGFRVAVRDGFEAVMGYGFAAGADAYRNLFLTRLTVYF
jgi:hypothetical protein